jgi:excinuclease ABC subunit C
MIKKLFDFNFSEVKKFLHREMFGFSEKMEFEKANDYLHRIKGLDKLEELVEPLRIGKYQQKAAEIKNILGLRKIPVIIEAFDNSHNQGDCNVAASVQYINEKPNKSEYRKYIIKEVNNGDDCASFEEVIFRRFKRVLDEKGKLPDLVLIDGGIGQFNVAKRVLDRLKLTGKIDLISISKNDNHRSSVIHTIDGKSHNMSDNQHFTVLGKIQEEVHRFAVKFHREKYSKKVLAG